MKQLLKKVGLLSVITLTVLLFTQCMSDQRKLDVFVKAFNTSCPLEMGGILRMEKAESLPDKKVKIYVTIFDKSGTLSSNTTAQLINKSVGAQITKVIATSPNMQALRDMSATVIIAMETEDGFVFDDIVITPEDYNNPQASQPAEENGPMSSIQASIDAMKEIMPFTDPTTGIIITDVYAEEGTTMVTVNVYPEELMAEVNKDKKTYIENLRTNTKHYLANSPGSPELLRSGAKIKYIYKSPDGETFAEMTFSKDDL